MWYVYLLRCADATLYCGVTTDMERRLREHNAGSRGAKYTRARRPVELVCCVAQPDASSACRLEREVKQRPVPRKRRFCWRGRSVRRKRNKQRLLRKGCRIAKGRCGFVMLRGKRFPVKEGARSC